MKEETGSQSILTPPPRTPLIHDSQIFHVDRWIGGWEGCPPEGVGLHPRIKALRPSEGGWRLLDPNKNHLVLKRRSQSHTCPPHQILSAIQSRANIFSSFGLGRSLSSSYALQLKAPHTVWVCQREMAGIPRWGCPCLHPRAPDQGEDSLLPQSGADATKWQRSWKSDGRGRAGCDGAVMDCMFTTSLVNIFHAYLATQKGTTANIKNPYFYILLAVELVHMAHL